MSTDGLPSHEIHCTDALPWLDALEVREGVSFVTSLPDVGELSLPLGHWETWFVDAASLILSRCAQKNVVIFYQTDIKVEGRWVDKGRLCQEAAARLGISQLWHKIVCRVRPGHTTRSRPSYAHLLCFSPHLRLDPAHATPDVIADPGRKDWSRGIETGVCRSVCRFLRDRTPTHTVIDPFCGRGTLLRIAQSHGLNAIGVDRSPKRCRRASAPPPPEL